MKYRIHHLVTLIMGCELLLNMFIISKFLSGVTVICVPQGYVFP